MKNNSPRVRLDVHRPMRPAVDDLALQALDGAAQHPILVDQLFEFVGTEVVSHLSAPITPRAFESVFRIAIGVSGRSATPRTTPENHVSCDSALSMRRSRSVF